MRKILLGFILALCTLQSCNLINASGTWENDHIDKDKREAIQKLNDKLIAAINQQDTTAMKSVMSDTLAKSGLSGIVELIAPLSSAFQKGQYKVLAEYYVRNNVARINNTVFSGLSGLNDYSVNYLALNREMYTTILLSPDPDKQYLILLVYGLYGDEWKLNILQFGQYRMFGKTPPEYYQLAKKCYDKGYQLDALLNAGIAKEFLKPANAFFHYQKEKEIEAFNDKITKEVNASLSLPITVSALKTGPRIHGIFPLITELGFFPGIFYQTRIDLADTLALKAENEALQKEIGGLFKGIDKDKKYLIYRAFNEMPQGTGADRFYGFVDTL